jgi:hypothetical protein
VAHCIAAEGLVLKRVTKLPAFDSMELDEELNSEVMLKCGKEGAHVSLTYTAGPRLRRYGAPSR